MFSQSIKIVRLQSAARLIARQSIRYQSNGKKDSLCKDHKDLVPPFSEVANLKSFELSSNCTSFSLKSSGYCPKKPCCPEPAPCVEPVKVKKAPCPCPEEDEVDDDPCTEISKNKK